MGDGALTQFQLVKQYPSASVIEMRTITKPVAGTLKVYLDGVEQPSGWSVDTTTGLVTVGTPPALGVEVTADFEFDVPVRFDTDHMAVTIESYRLHRWVANLHGPAAEGVSPRSPGPANPVVVSGNSIRVCTEG
jgi:uncharacterized protein (TIGR02217 family)